MVYKSLKNLRENKVANKLGVSKFGVQADKRRRLTEIWLVGVIPDIGCYWETWGFKDKTPFCRILS